MPTLTVIKHFDVIKNIAAGFKAVGGDIETCCNAGNRMTTINNLFDCFNFKLFGIQKVVGRV
ncbi:hypothetical protein PU00_05875 [Hafnia alvei]|nr:hypothetical protein PU00_05875 [Hafnia alvei]